MPDVKVNVTGTGSGHLDYPVPGGVEFILKQAYASFDGTAAASAWYPAVRLIGPDGNVAGEYITTASVAAAGSADVTFAPFLRGSVAAAATTFPRAAFLGNGQTSVGATTVRQQWLSCSTNDSSVFAIDGSDNTKANLLKAGDYICLGYFGLKVIAPHTMAGNGSAFLNLASGGTVQVSNFPLQGEVETTYPNLGGGHGAISGLTVRLAADALRVDWSVTAGDQSSVELHSQLYVVKVN